MTTENKDEGMVPVSVRIPRELLMAIEVEAEREHRSRHAQILLMLTEYEKLQRAVQAVGMEKGEETVVKPLLPSDPPKRVRGKEKAAAVGTDSCPHGFNTREFCIKYNGGQLCRK